ALHLEAGSLPRSHRARSLRPPRGWEMSKRAPRQPPPAPGALLSRSSCYISRTVRSPIRTKLDHTVKPAIEMSVLGRFLGQEGQGVGQHVEDGLQVLDRPGLRARRVEDDAAPDRAGEASAEP